MKFFPKTLKRAKRAVALDEIKENSSYLKYLFTGLIRLGRPQKANPVDANTPAPETFEAMGYTPEVLEKSKATLKKYVFFYLVILGLSVLYFIDCLVKRHIDTALLMICFMFFCGVLAFRNHFQLFLLKQNRPQGTVSEWRKSLFQGRRRVS